MKYKINIISNNNINNFLSTLFPEYELSFISLEKINYNLRDSQPKIFIITNNQEIDLINTNNLNSNNLILTNLKNKNINLHNDIKIYNTPLSINHLKNIIKNFVQNLKIEFHDIFIENEKLTNLKNKSFCYLTKVEFEILKHLIREKESNKNFIKENILNIKLDIETNSLESHLTRIRKKMIQVKTAVKIKTKSERLLISI